MRGFLMYILILLLAGCGLIFPEDEETTSTPADDSSGGDTGGSSGGGSSCTIASSSFEVVGGETAGQDWEGFAHEVDNSSQTGSMIQSFSIGNASSVSCSACQESALHWVRLRTPAELKSENTTLWSNLTTDNGTHLIHMYGDSRGHPGNLNYDNGTYSNRAELSTNRTDEKYTVGDERYYSLKFWLPSANYHVIISQWKQYSGQPNFVVRVSNAGDYKLIVKSHGDMGVANTEIGTANPNAWNALKYHIKHSEGNDGLFKIWLNGSLIYNYSGKTMHQTNKDGYFKFGMYTQIRRENHILFDNLRISPDLRCETLAEWVAD